MNGFELTGQRIGEYEVGKKLGQGGMGVVYEGLHPVIGKRVALKVLLPALSNDASLVERFVAEARAVNAIGHRGIVDIFSFGVLADGSHYFVMELLRGTPFDKLLLREHRLHPALAVDLVIEVLDALDAAHAAGVIHRDLKPSNLFLVEEAKGRRYVKLLDFGIAKLGALAGQSTPQTRASMIMGTPDYMAPEQVRGAAISAASDLYSLGCVLFELLTGKRPFSGDNPLQTMFKHTEEMPPKPSDLAAVPVELDQLVGWMLEKSPQKRPQSAELLKLELLQLRRSLGDPPQLTTPIPRPVVPVADRVTPTGAGATRASRPSLVPLPAGHTVVDPTQLRAAVTAPLPVHAEPAPKARGGRAGALALFVPLAVVCGAAVFALLWESEPPPQMTVPLPAPRVEPRVPVKEDTPAPEPAPAPAVVVPSVDAGTPGVTAARPQGPPSAAQLKAKLTRLQATLARQAGGEEPDPMLQRLFAQAERQVAEARTAEDRRVAARFLAELAQQVER